jgi:hypothetical protein
MNLFIHVTLLEYKKKIKDLNIKIKYTYSYFRFDGSQYVNLLLEKEIIDDLVGWLMPKLD